MNRRRREILAAFEPAFEYALKCEQRANLRTPRDVPGLALHARVTAEAPAELMIYGYIGGGGWFSEGIGASDVAALLREAGPGPVNVRINSGGGDAFQGVAIHTLLARHPGLVHTFNDGLAASAASVILMAGDEITSSKYAMTMIHDGMTGPYGNSKTLRRSADLLDQVSQTMAELYADKAGEDADHWRALMTENDEDGKWYTGAEALAVGLVDHVTEVKDDGPEEDLVWDRLAGWVGVLPEAVAAKVRTHTEKEPVHTDDKTSPIEPVEDEATEDADRDWAFAALTAGWK